jgi:RimJ/RimL family protein N-acetyltransferase
MDDVDWPLRTERLTIRPATPDDADAVWEFRRQPEVHEWITRAPGRTPEEHRRQFAEPGRLGHTLVIELDGRIIGDLMLDIQDAWAQAEVADQGRAAQAELGWTLDPAYGGHGYATEAVRELMRVCFKDLRLRRVLAACFTDNEASWRLMERLGMRREAHHVGDSLHRTRGWLDEYIYAMLASEFGGQR